MATTQKSFIAAGFIIAVGIAIYEAGKASQYRDRVRALEQKQTPLVAQVDQLTRDRETALSLQVALQQENEKLRQATAELPKLRAEVARLRPIEKQVVQSKTSDLNANDPAVRNFLAAKEKAERISHYLEQMPEKNIPELAILTDVDWLSATQEAKFDTPDDVRRTLAHLRSLAKSRLPIGRSLNDFIQANNGDIPTDLSQLKPFIKSALGEKSVDDAMLDSILQRYTLWHPEPGKESPPGGWIIVEKAPVDKDYDSRAKFGNGRSTVISTGSHSTGDPDDKSY